jgi:hypothetical protein
LGGCNIIEFVMDVELVFGLSFSSLALPFTPRSIRQLYRNLLWSVCLDYTMTYAQIHPSASRTNITFPDGCLETLLKESTEPQNHPPAAALSPQELAGQAVSSRSRTFST